MNDLNISVRLAVREGIESLLRACGVLVQAALQLPGLDDFVLLLVDGL